MPGSTAESRLAQPAELLEICPHFREAIALLGKRWTGLILRALSDGPCRFNKMASIVPGLSDRMLSARLRELETAGLVERTVYDEVPVRIEYRLTDKGADLRPVLDAVQEWAQRWQMAAGPADCD